MERTDESSVIVTEHGATAKKIYSFPSFFDAQFWTWQIIEFCRRNGLHLIIDKTRRGGFSSKNFKLLTAKSLKPPCLIKYLLSAAT